jgi:serine acetyltransferase
MDIHPAAKMGVGVLIDHATGVVIGETAAVGDGCTLLHGVTLGGTGKETEDRHPKLGKNVGSLSCICELSQRGRSNKNSLIAHFEF